MAGFFSKRDEDAENVSDTENEEPESEDEEQQSAVEADALHLHLQAIVEGTRNCFTSPNCRPFA